MNILITGATSGIGQQLALDYVAQGDEVIVCGRNQQVLDELQARSPLLHSLALDVTNLKQCIKAFGQLPFVPDIWIFNAGVCEYIDNGELDSGLIKRVMDVNFFGVVHCLEAMIPYQAQGQQVVVVSSIAGELALPRAEAYGASKAAISYLTQALALDWERRGIALSLVMPGFVATPLTQKNTFSMPMMISVNEASQQIRQQLREGKRFIYLPKRFTTLLRLVAMLPYRWQQKLVQRWILS